MKRSGVEQAGTGGYPVGISALWLGLPVLVLAFSFLRFAGAASQVAFAASQAVFLSAACLGLVGSLMALRSTEGRLERRPWVTFTVACAAIAAGETYFSGYQVLVDPRGPVGLSASDALYAIGALAFATGLVSVSSFSRMPRVAIARRVVDSLGLAVVVFAVAYAIIHALTDQIPGSLIDDVAQAAYVVVGIVIVAVVALDAVASRNRRRDAWERILAVALGTFGVGVTLAPIWFLFLRTSDVQRAEIAIASVFLCSYYLIFVAGVYRSQATGVSSAALAPAADRVLAVPQWEGVITSTVLLVAIPILGVAAFSSSIDSQEAVVNFVAMALVGTAMVAHTALDAVYTGRLRRRAGTDPLTGLPDARSLHTLLAEAITGFERYGDPISVVVLDLNDFSRINTLYGRDEGDRLMREVARALASGLPPHTALGRLGSDEFMAILEGTDRAEALLMADGLRSALHVVLTSAGLPLSASWGVASCPQDSMRPRDLVTKAYAAQYWAKTRGGNRLASYDAARMGAPDHVARITAAEEHADLTMLLAIVMASEARHETTRFHSRNVAAMSVLVAELTGATPEEVHDVEIAALLHDIGKTGVPDEVLMKQEPRSRAEEAAFRDHVIIGERIVAATQLRRVAPAVRAHHERWDGRGYPDGLVANDIPRVARIIAVCDVFEGLTSGRPDRRPLSLGAALQELDQNMGVAYDPDVVEALIAVAEDLPRLRRDDEGGGAA